MKIALITDTHFGARGDNHGFLQHFEEFFEDIFFPTLKERNIRHVFHLGDLVDRRKYANYLTLSRMRNSFLAHFRRDDTLHCTIICGNHDVYFKNTNEINALKELLAPYSFTVLENPQHLTIANETFLFLPWINPDNAEKAYEEISKSKAKYVFGHLELQGFEMHAGSIATHGLDSSVFSKFSGVYTGHFHHKSSRNNIHYLGSPYQITWSDYADPRGFHILDTDTGDLEFIQNPYNMFHKIVYDDRERSLDDLMGLDFFSLHKKYVKVIIQHREQPYFFDRLIEEIEKVQPYSLQVVDSVLDFSNVGTLISSENIESYTDTLTIIKNSVQELPDTVNKTGLEALLVDLYNRAQQKQV